MKKIVLLSVVGVMLLTSSTCVRIRTLEPSAQISTRSLPITEALTLDVAAGADVKFLPGPDSAMISIVAPDNYMEFIKVDIAGTNLRVSMDSNNNNLDTDAINITVMSPNITGLSASSGADIEVLSPWVINPAASGKVDVSSGANIEIKARVEAAGGLKVTTSSGSDLDIKGAFVSTLTADASSGSDIDIDGVEAVTVNASASSGADVSLEGRATSLNANSSSGGDVKAKKLITGVTVLGPSSQSLAPSDTTITPLTTQP